MSWKHEKRKKNQLHKNIIFYYSDPTNVEKIIMLSLSHNFPLWVSKFYWLHHIWWDFNGMGQCVEYFLFVEFFFVVVVLAAFLFDWFFFHHQIVRFSFSEFFLSTLLFLLNVLLFTFYSESKSFTRSQRYLHIYIVQLNSFRGSWYFGVKMIPMAVILVSKYEEYEFRI